MKLKPLIILWLCWAFITLGYQAIVKMRFILKSPDTALGWTVTETSKGGQDSRYYLKEPFMNNHVAWDSEFYLSIAVKGYDDPEVRYTFSPDGKRYSLNYAFFPFYPFMIKIFAFPLKLSPLNPVAAASLAGVIVSLLGALAGMIALYYIAKPDLGEEGAFRTSFYLLIFPGAFFMAQVYTEGLFIGLAFSSIALCRNKKLAWAAALAALAVWTRAVGILLFIPLAYAFIKEINWKELSFKPFPWKLLKGLLIVIPIAAFLIWKFSLLGEGFEAVESTFFNRGLLQYFSIDQWLNGFSLLLYGGNPSTRVYYAMEYGSIFLGLVSVIFTFKKYPDIALFSFFVIFISLASGPAQGMIRYVLAAPSLFLYLGEFGKNKVFDRAWSYGSVLLAAMLMTLFTFDFWVG